MSTHAAVVRRSAKAGKRAGEQSLADALFTATQQRLLGLLFGQPERSFFVTELIELACVGRGAVQRELARLARSELVVIERHGNQKHYRANPDAPAPGFLENTALAGGRPHGRRRLGASTVKSGAM